MIPRHNNQRVNREQFFRHHSVRSRFRQTAAARGGHRRPSRISSLATSTSQAKPRLRSGCFLDACFYCLTGGDVLDANREPRQTHRRFEGCAVRERRRPVGRGSTPATWRFPVTVRSTTRSACRVCRNWGVATHVIIDVPVRDTRAASYQRSRRSGTRKPECLPVKREPSALTEKNGYDDEGNAPRCDVGA